MTAAHRALGGLLSLLLANAVLAHAQRPAYYFAEIGGPGGLASLNLEANPVGPLRTRLGAGLFLYPSIPITATATVGSDQHALELGVGTTIIIVPAKSADQHLDLLDWGNPNGTLIIGTGTFGYRYSPRSGWLFRVSLTPLYYKRHAALWVGVSLGRRFKS